MIARDIFHFRRPVTPPPIADVENQDNLRNGEIDKVIQQPVLAAEASAPTNEPPSADKHGDMAPPTYNEATAHSTESTAEKLDLSRVF